jgi:hypothetical protein
MSMSNTATSKFDERFWEMLRAGLDRLQTDAESFPGEPFSVVEIEEARKKLDNLEAITGAVVQLFPELQDI